MRKTYLDIGGPLLNNAIAFAFILFFKDEDPAFFAGYFLCFVIFVICALFAKRPRTQEDLDEQWQ